MTDAINVLHPLATKLDSTSHWMAAQADPETFDWEGNMQRLTDNGVDAFYDVWKEFEKVHDLHTKFENCVLGETDPTTDDSEAKSAFSLVFDANDRRLAELEVIRQAVVSATMIEVGTDELQSGETRASVLRECRANLSALKLEIPVFISKVVRARQTSKPRP